MKKSLLTLTTAAIMAATMSITSWAMTAEEVTAKTPTSYTAGTNSVYGPKLTQEQLNAVAQATADFMTNNITDNMSTDDKIKAAYDYIKTRTTYVDWNAVTGANTAYTLVTGQGACSGMCRSMKALCDAMGIECYHVHSTSNDHQWNLVRFGDGILYHVDIDANKSAGQDVIYKSLTHPLPFDTSAYPAVGQAQEQGQEQATTPQPTDGIHTMRASQEGSNLSFWDDEEGLPLYQYETYNGVEYKPMDKGVITFRIIGSESNVNPSNHSVLIMGFKATNNPDIPFSIIGEPRVYPLEYDKAYSYDFTGNHPTAPSLYQYCVDNDIMIKVSVIDDYATSNNSFTGWEYYKRYATPQSVPTGQIG